MSFSPLKKVLQQCSLNPSMTQKVFCFLLCLVYFDANSMDSNHQFGKSLITVRFCYSAAISLIGPRIIAGTEFQNIMKGEIFKILMILGEEVRRGYWGVLRERFE